MNTWSKQQAKEIERLARDRYGAGWALLSDEQRQNYLQSRVLMLLLAQGGEQFKAAQELARSVLTELQPGALTADTT